MYVVTVEFTVAKNNQREFMEAMIAQAGNSLRLEPGCHQFDVCVDPKDEQRVYLYEIYTDRAAFDLHLESDHFKDFDALVRPWLESKTVSLWERIER